MARTGTNRNSAKMKNFVPLPYRRVAVREVDFPLTAQGLRKNLLHREAYRRTEFIVLRRGNETAIARIERANADDLFSPIALVELFAAPSECIWADDDTIDVGNPSQLARKARELHVDKAQTLIVHGKYEHVNFIHHPEPSVIHVIDVVPPEPAKLWTMANQVLAFANDLPAIELQYTPIDLIELARAHPAPAYLFPCQASQIDVGAPIYFLDTRPALREWTLIGCERSLQFHQHFYGAVPPQVDYCPRYRTKDDGELILTKCCLLETHIECQSNRAIVPWGATMQQIDEALRYLASRIEEDSPRAVQEAEKIGDC